MFKPIETTLWTPAPYAREPLAYFEGKPLRIGSGAQLLGHSALVEDRRGLTRQVIQPQRRSEPVLTAERAWENHMVFGPQILTDERTGGLRMWYGTLPPLPPDGSIPPYLLLYAESEDGLTWHRPELTITSYGTHERTNIVYHGPNNNCSAFRIVDDQGEPDAARRFKMIHKGGRDANGVQAEEMALSPDGINWTPYEGNPVMPHRHDCNLNLLYDTTRQMWTAYARPYAFSSNIWPGMRPAGQPKAHHRRRISVAESQDLIHWSRFRTALGPEEGDPNEFDNIAVLPWGDTLIGIIGLFEESDNATEQRIYTELAFSVDGRRWERVPGKQPFLAPTGVDGDFDSDSVGASATVLRDDQTGEFLLYYNGFSWNKGNAFDSASAIGVARFAPDRLVEQRAGDEEGWLLTREFLLEGDEITVNCWVDGFLKVELAEYPGHGIPGFTLEDCDPIIGDHLARTITWRGGQRSLSALRDRPVYLRFHLQEAGLYAFTVR